MRMSPFYLSFAVIVAALPPSLEARELHVAKTGNDSASGESGSPYLTINQAAKTAQPGDTIIVHEGVYRETVVPARGGTSDERRIVYRAASGEKVEIKGSERVTNWQKLPEKETVWTATLPDSFFGDVKTWSEHAWAPSEHGEWRMGPLQEFTRRYNPFALKLTGGWLNYGAWHHRGDVYLNDAALLEKRTRKEVFDSPHSWFAEQRDGMTILTCNFGSANPNEALTEINVRRRLFMPAESGLSYITVDGFHFSHAAPNWAPPVETFQDGAIGTRMGKRWIIENCVISNSRCVGIILGKAPGVDYRNIDLYGDHIIRNNHIRRCGQAGIAGHHGATRCLVESNLIEETNYRREFGGWETASIKFHHSVDVVIRNNLIRHTYHQKQGAFGIWLDYSNQGARVSGNIIYDTDAAPLFLEMNHGPTLVDNNIFVGKIIRTNSEATVFGNNIFVDAPYVYHQDMRRASSWYIPHTKIPSKEGRKCVPRDERWYNNLFIRAGLDKVKAGPGYAADHNVFLEGAKPSRFGDENSLVSSEQTGFAVAETPLGATVTFEVNRAVCDFKGITVDEKLIGRFEVTGQTIEDQHGNPAIVDHDRNGNPFKRPMPGPLANLRPGKNTIHWSLRKQERGHSAF